MHPVVLPAVIVPIFLTNYNLFLCPISYRFVEQYLSERVIIIYICIQVVEYYIGKILLHTSSGSVSLNSQPSPVHEMKPWQLLSVRSSSRNCHSWIGPEPENVAHSCFTIYDL